MKNKRLILSAAILGGTLGLAANPVWAQTVEKKSVPAAQDRIPTKPSADQALPPRASESKAGAAMSAQDIQKVQDALKAKGHNPGTTGAMDDQTRDAIRAFQEANNLTLTGTVDEKTAAALGVTLSSSTKSGDKSTRSSGIPNGSSEKPTGSTSKSSAK
jgi:peptidoglycan hydrolase-like protein with peptidoglycan-binding domain